jgi:hypothetical protein
LHPIGFAGWLERNRTLQVADSRHSARRIVLLTLLILTLIPTLILSDCWRKYKHGEKREPEHTTAPA